MGAAHRPWAADLLHLWFQKLRPRQWFGRSDALDALLVRRYAPQIAKFRRRPPQEFLRDPLTARAAILLFDQVPRNSFRDSPRAFATDKLAARRSPLSHAFAQRFSMCPVSAPTRPDRKRIQSIFCLAFTSRC